MYDQSQEGPTKDGEELDDDDSDDDGEEEQLLNDDDLSELSSVMTVQTDSTLSTADTEISAVHIQLGKLLSLGRCEKKTAATPPVQQGPKHQDTYVRKFSLLSSLCSTSAPSSSPSAVITSSMSHSSKNTDKILPDYVALLHILLERLHVVPVECHSPFRA
eukprot:s3682_g5.t1